MKLTDLISLNEMTSKINYFPDDLSNYYNFMLNEPELVGDIDGMYVFKKSHEDSFFLFLSKEKESPEVLTFIFVKKDNSSHVLHVAHTKDELRGKGLIKRLLFFVKSKMGHSLIDYGAITDAGEKMYDSMHNSDMFKMSWLHVKTGKKVPYSEKEGKIERNVDTGWRVVIESNVECFPSSDIIITESGDKIVTKHFFGEML